MQSSLLSWFLKSGVCHASAEISAALIVCVFVFFCPPSLLFPLLPIHTTLLFFFLYKLALKQLLLLFLLHRYTYI